MHRSIGDTDHVCLLDGNTFVLPSQRGTSLCLSATGYYLVAHRVGKAVLRFVDVQHLVQVLRDIQAHAQEDHCNDPSGDSSSSHPSGVFACSSKYPPTSV